MRKWLTSPLLRRLVAALVIVSIVPLLGLGFLARESYNVTQEEAVAQTKDSLESGGFENLEGRAVAIAGQVSHFLEERESDLYIIAELPRDEASYLGFAKGAKAKLRTLTADDTLYDDWVPLYREVVFINTEGEELVKIVNVCNDYPFDCHMQTAEFLGDVSDPANTLLKAETYFDETMALEQGQIYVSDALGVYVPYVNAYAGTQSRDGDRYRGILRFATPVYDGSRQVGIVVISLETIHLIELTAHVAPANIQPQIEIDPREADFAYMIDPNGWAISHPRHFNIAGVDPETGQRVPPISDANRDDPENLFHPGKLDEMAFIDPVYPQLVEENKSGASGTETIQPSDFVRQARTLSYATIPYYGGQYETDAGFGMVILSTDGSRFSLDADTLGKQIKGRIDDLTDNFVLLISATGAISLFFAILLARGIAFPILELTETSIEIEEGRWEDADLEGLAAMRGNDEVSTLSRVFASMAKQVKVRENTLKQKVQQLEIVIEEKKLAQSVSEITESEFFVDLAEKAAEMRKARRDKNKGD